MVPFAGTSGIVEIESDAQLGVVGTLTEISVCVFCEILCSFQQSLFSACREMMAGASANDTHGICGLGGLGITKGRRFSFILLEWMLGG
jgi:hypothetical protein